MESTVVKAVMFNRGILFYSNCLLVKENTFQTKAIFLIGEQCICGLSDGDARKLEQSLARSVNARQRRTGRLVLNRRPTNNNSSLERVTFPITGV